MKPTADQWRAAAAAALTNPHESPAQCRARADYYEQQAKLAEEKMR